MGDTWKISFHRTRKHIIELFIGVLVVLLGTVYGGLFWLLERHVDEDNYQLIHRLGNMWTIALDNESLAMKTGLHVITQSESLQTLFMSGDREGLLRQAIPIYNGLVKNCDIGQFNFIDRNLAVFLRVDDPSRHGDPITHPTLHKAVDTKDVAWGLELDTSGDLVLRVVMPWLRGQEILGYLELGENIEHLLPDMRTLVGGDLGLLVCKDRVPSTYVTHYPNVLAYHGKSLLIAATDHYHDELENGGMSHEPCPSRHVKILKNRDGASIMMAGVPVADANGLGFSELRQTIDVSDMVNRNNRMLFLVFLVGVILAVTGSLVFVFLLGKVEGWMVKAERDKLRMRDESLRDGLTNLYNRRAFTEALGREAEAQAFDPREVSILMTDVDHFKKVNDTYGHPVGDAVLRAIAANLGTATRPSDFVARYGGEEFVVLMPKTGIASAVVVAERIRQTIAATPIDIGAGRVLTVTISIGAATVPPRSPELSTLVDLADKALYAAKQKGRNRVEVFAPGEGEGG
ncbi:MAG: diguanylate cyclase [Alphaproteobacteria bacterium]|nr:diguanylate cyclase [Alphaproteobacteria bacterium]